MTDIRMDWGRAARTGIPEAVYCAGKSIGQVQGILDQAQDRGASLLLTRMPEDMAKALRPALDYHPLSRTAILGPGLTPPVDRGAAIVAAGTSDAAIAHEARRTLEFSGIAAPTTVDVGVAGLWRLTQAVETLQDRRIIIAVAGFEAALFSVLAGLVAAPVIAVPASVGEGVAAGGHTALHSALASCAPGVTVVNIDNGFGAACAAIKILQAAERPLTGGTP